MKPVYYSKQAEYTYFEIIDFLEKTWNARVKSDFQELLDKRLKDLSKTPQLGKRIATLPFRQLIIHRNISIFYREYDHHILLLAIWDNRQSSIKLNEILKVFRA